MNPHTQNEQVRMRGLKWIWFPAVLIALADRFKTVRPYMSPAMRQTSKVLQNLRYESCSQSNVYLCIPPFACGLYVWA